MSASAKPAPIVDILKDLIHHMIDQLFSMLSYCTELVLYRYTLLSSCGHYSRIMSRTSERSGVLIELRHLKQLGSYASNLRNPKCASIVEIALLVLGKLHAEQEHSFEEVEKDIAERTRQLDETRDSY